MIVEMLAGSGSVVIGFLIGRAHRPRRTYRERKVEPMCGCRHHKSLHDPATGKCHGGFDYYKKPVESRDAYHPCGCRHYVGPEPLPEFYAPEIGG